MKAYPTFDTTAAENPSLENTAVAEYDIYFASAGTFELDLYRMPTLNERGAQRAAVAIDGDEPIVLTGTNEYQEANIDASAWAKQVMINNETLSVNVTVSEPGIHTLRLYAMDPGFIVDKIVITTGEKKESYLGAPESYNSTYNSEAPQFPEAKPVDTTDTAGDFKPNAVTVGTVTDVGRLTGVELVKTDSSVEKLMVTAVTYAADGTMEAYETKTADTSDRDMGERYTVDGFSLKLSGAARMGIIVYKTIQICSFKPR